MDKKCPSCSQNLIYSKMVSAFVCTCGHKEYSQGSFKEIKELV